ncbi:MAG: c-type cytochrome [Rhodobacter sp.]|nr:c-type cytochrome [Rhodobacter sp.]
MKLAFATALIGLISAGAASAQDPEEGAALFQIYCASCHGDAATGDGVMTSVLNIAVPDLTGLSRGNDGVFPRAWVVYKIDGRDPVLAHGGEMPFFGDLFEGEMTAFKTASGQPILTGAGIVSLVMWLETQQR